jgi:hypothetical protein
MNNLLRIILLAGIGVIFCVDGFGQRLADAKWLLGRWEQTTPKRTIYEIWTSNSDSTYSGKSYLLKEKDTIVLETVSLLQKEGVLFYIPTVTNQNNSMPVSFKLTFTSGNKLVFENPGHDFPQKITYTLISSDSLMAEISGTLNDKEQLRQFPMKRIF